MQRQFNDNSHKLILNQKVRRVVPKLKLLLKFIEIVSVLRKAECVLFFLSLVHCISDFSPHCLRTFVSDYTNFFGNTLYFKVFLK